MKVKIQNPKKQKYDRLQNEGGEGYNPYSDWVDVDLASLPDNQLVKFNGDIYQAGSLRQMLAVSNG